jgi:hypothetical protein
MAGSALSPKASLTARDSTLILRGEAQVTCVAQKIKERQSARDPPVCILSGGMSLQKRGNHGPAGAFKQQGTVSLCMSLILIF